MWELLGGGRVGVEQVRRRGVDCSFLDKPETMGLTPDCRWLEEVERRGEAGQETGEYLEQGVLSHCLGLGSVQGKGEVSSLHSSSWALVDSILHSKEITLVAALTLPTALQVLILVYQQELNLILKAAALGPLPSEICPSDHFPLVADFRLHPTVIS